MFVAFAPVEDPQIAVSVIVENGGHGGSTAAPIARQLMDYYLLPLLKQQELEQQEAERREQEKREKERLEREKETPELQIKTS